MIDPGTKVDPYNYLEESNCYQILAAISHGIRSEIEKKKVVHSFTH